MKLFYRALIPLLLIAAGIVLIRWEVPYTIRAKGMVKPLQEWSLHMAPDGILSASLEDHLLSGLSQYHVMELQRGDVMSFRFNRELIAKGWVEAGDTIAWGRSHDLSMRLTEAKGNLAYQQALLQVYLSGDKPEIIRMARQESELARQEASTQEKLTARIVQLYEQDLVPEQDYELAMNELKVRQAELDIAEARLEAILAGEKDEQVELARSRIATLERQVEGLIHHLDDMNILSPISGMVLRQRELNGEAGNEVIRLASSSGLLVLAPVNLNESHLLKTGQAARISSEHNRREIQGRLVDVDNSVQWLNRRPSVFVTILIEENNEHGLMPNTLVDTYITTDTLRLKDYLLRMSRAVMAN